MKDQACGINQGRQLYEIMRKAYGSVNNNNHNTVNNESIYPFWAVKVLLQVCRWISLLPSWEPKRLKEVTLKCFWYWFELGSLLMFDPRGRGDIRRYMLLFFSGFLKKRLMLQDDPVVWDGHMYRCSSMSGSQGENEGVGRVFLALRMVVLNMTWGEIISPKHSTRVR